MVVSMALLVDNLARTIQPKEEYMPKPILRIDALGDYPVITGKREVVSRAVDLSILRYVEVDGQIITKIYDPRPYIQNEVSNSIIRRFGNGERNSNG